MTLAVIGAGLFGAAAARHAAKVGADVLLIGPDEPTDWSTHSGVFASHYDEGRITRRNSTSPFWIEVSDRSMSRYAEITAESGIAFHTPCGQLTLCHAGSAKAVAWAKAGADSRSTRLDNAALGKRYPYLKIDGELTGWIEENGAGHISPRRLAKAQTQAAIRHGARRVAAEAKAIKETRSGVVITTLHGEIEADHAVIAAGGWSGHLVGQPDLFRVKTRTVALFQLSEREAARLGDMPTLIDARRDHGSPYLLPPIRYPDGAWYLKLGGDTHGEYLDGPDEISDWFRSGGSAAAEEELIGWMADIVPDLTYETVTRKPCVTTLTASGQPIIEKVSRHVTLCAGGNGTGAKNSDELGRRGAMLALAATRQEVMT